MFQQLWQPSATLMVLALGLFESFLLAEAQAWVLHRQFEVLALESALHQEAMSVWRLG